MIKNIAILLYTDEHGSHNYVAWLWSEIKKIVYISAVKELSTIDSIENNGGIAAAWTPQTGHTAGSSSPGNIGRTL